jgi:hypothetical protein
MDISPSPDTIAQVAALAAVAGWSSKKLTAFAATVISTLVRLGPLLERLGPIVEKLEHEVAEGRASLDKALAGLQNEVSHISMRVRSLESSRD